MTQTTTTSVAFELPSLQQCRDAAWDTESDCALYAFIREYQPQQKPEQVVEWRTFLEVVCQELIEATCLVLAVTENPA